MTAPDGLAVFILTYGRAGNVQTLDSLAKSGWTGPVHLLVSTDDPALDAYRREHGDMVVTFSKDDYEGTFDMADIEGDQRVVVYARNASQAIARDMGYSHMFMLDDDYFWFGWRFADAGRLLMRRILDLDTVLAHLVDMLESTGAAAVALGQGGDYIGGVNGSSWRRGLIRKVMNSFVINTARPVEFVGRINEDTNTYVSAGARGDLFLTPVRLCVEQEMTQQQTGGLTDAYNGNGTYWKSFYTVMMHPSSVSVSVMGTKHPRLHHLVSWRHTVPLIVSEKHRKP